MSKSRSMVMQMLLDDSDGECDEQINVAAVAAGTALLVAHANKRLKHGGSVAGGDRVGQEGQAISAKAKDDSKKLPSASGKFGEKIERELWRGVSGRIRARPRLCEVSSTNGCHLGQKL